MRARTHRFTAATGLIAVAAASLLAGCAAPVVVRSGWAASADRELPACSTAYTDEFVSRGIWTIGDPAQTVDTVVANGPSPSCVLVGTDDSGDALDSTMVLATYLDLNADEIDQALSAIRDYAGSAGMTSAPLRVSDGISTLVFDGSGGQLVVSYAAQLDPAVAESLRVDGSTSYVAVTALSAG